MGESTSKQRRDIYLLEKLGVGLDVPTEAVDVVGNIKTSSWVLGATAPILDDHHVNLKYL